MTADIVNNVAMSRYELPITDGAAAVAYYAEQNGLSCYDIPRFRTNMVGKASPRGWRKPCSKNSGPKGSA